MLRWSGPAAANVDTRGLAAELRRLSEALGTVVTTEFQVTAITQADAAGIVPVDVRVDLVGTGPGAERIEQAGTWKMRWRADAKDTWQVVEWTPADQVISRAPRPIFTEITASGDR